MKKLVCSQTSIKYFTSLMSLQTYIFVTPNIQSYGKSISLSNKYISEFKTIIIHLPVWFPKNHSTDFCLSYLNGKILKSFDKGFDDWHDSDWSSKGLWHNWSWRTFAKIICYWFLETYCKLVSILFIQQIIFG